VCLLNVFNLLNDFYSYCWQHFQVLCEIKGLSEAKVEKCVEAAKKIVLQFGWQSASQFASKVVHMISGKTNLLSKLKYSES
jgi:hypothetical protein